MTFSERLVQLQQERGIDKKDIFTACNISRVSYYRYESGDRTPTYEALLALADYFNVSIDYLVGRTDNPEINR
jgi:transcriptional regulator with XRE-family HTH domain